MSGKVPSVTSPPWGTTTKRLVALVLVGVVVLMVRQVSKTAWNNLVIALVLAYLLSPIVTFFERRLGLIRHFEMRRTLSVLLTWLVVVGALALTLGLIIPATITQLRQFAEDLPGLVQRTEQDLEDALSKPITIGDFTIVPWQELKNAFAPKDGSTSGSSLTDTLQNAALSTADSALNVVGGAVSFVFSLFLVLILLYYLMRDGPLFAAYIVEAVPESYRGDVLRLLHELGLIWNAYLRGQLLLNLSVGLATYISALILGLPQPLLLGIFAGFLELVPNIGPTISSIPAILFAFTAPSSTIPGLHAGFVYALVTAGAYIAIQQFEAVFLVPRILGHSLDLHPFVVLISIMIAAGIAGILGIILAAPTVATLRLMLRYLRGKLLDEELFPPLPHYAVQQRGFVFRIIRYFLSRRFPLIPADSIIERPPLPAEGVVEPPDRSDASGWAI
jgi:predicted PurR-regulated permease PerM